MSEPSVDAVTTYLADVHGLMTSHAQVWQGTDPHAPLLQLVWTLAAERVDFQRQVQADATFAEQVARQVHDGAAGWQTANPASPDLPAAVAELSRQDKLIARILAAVQESRRQQPATPVQRKP